MKKSLYTFGAGIIALMGLTSFNPLAENFRLASVESSASFAATATKPQAQAEAKKEAAQAQPTKIPLIEQAYIYGVGKYTGKPGYKFSTKSGSYLITEISLTTTTSGGNNDPFDIDSIGKDNSPVTTSVVNVCVKDAPTTQGQVCQDCIAIPEVCGNVNVDFAKLGSRDDETATNEIKKLRDQAKLVADEAVKIENEKIIAAEKQRANCEYFKDTAKKVKDTEKILECVVDQFRNSDDPKIRRKFALKFRNMVMQMAKSGDEDQLEILADIADEYEITARDRELFKSLDTANKYASFMTKSFYGYNNAPEFFETKLNGLLDQLSNIDINSKNPADQAYLAWLKNQIDNTTYSYATYASNQLGRPTNDPFGITGEDYKTVFYGFNNRLGGPDVPKSILLSNGYAGMLKLMYGSIPEMPTLDSGTQSTSPSNRDILGNPTTDNRLCYDPATARQIPCSSNTTIGNIGSQFNGRTRGSVSDKWWDAAQSTTTTQAQDRNNFFNSLF